MPRITSSAPVLLVRDVIAAADYYRDALGFTSRHVYGEPPDFCIVHRDDHHLMLAKVDANSIKPHGHIRPGMSSAYFWVDDADALHAQLQAAGTRIDHALGTKPYGVREFGIRDIDGHDIRFGQIVDV
jgi:uncharacterized glyoxalase superfamily protein PhnB